MAEPIKVRRQDLEPGEVLCSYCAAKCCRYFALPLDAPTTRDDFDNMRWFLMHGQSAIFVEDGTWYLMIYNDCQHLMPDQRCAIYPERPKVCRGYSVGKCEYDDDACYDRFFETAEQVWEYGEAVLPRAQWRRKGRRRQVGMVQKGVRHRCAQHPSGRSGNGA